MKKITIIGAGGHGRVVASILHTMAKLDSSIKFAGFIDRQPGKDSYFGSTIGTDEQISDLTKDNKISHFIIGLGVVKGGDNVRETLFERARSEGLIPMSAISPFATLAEDVKIGTGTVIMPGVVINTGAIIGQNCIINTGAIIDHDCNIGDNVHIAPGCVLSGNVSVGRQTLIGVGTCVRHGVAIGHGCTIGAGSNVVGSIESRSIAFGNPARRQQS